MITNLQELSTEISNIRAGKRIVLATGTFDLFHYEHLKYLEGAKQYGDILMVGIKNNRCARLKAEGRPIIDEQHRIAIVNAIKYVDYTFLVDYNPNLTVEIQADNQKQQEWLTMFQETFRMLKPDILYHEDNPKLQTAREKVFQKYGIKGVKKLRGKGASTTEIINKIITNA